MAQKDDCETWANPCFFQRKMFEPRPSGGWMSVMSPKGRSTWHAESDAAGHWQGGRDPAVWVCNEGPE